MMSTTSAVNNVNRVNDVNHVQKSDAARRRCKTRASARRWGGSGFLTSLTKNAGTVPRYSTTVNDVNNVRCQ
jgi:hypothetical protein